MACDAYLIERWLHFNDGFVEPDRGHEQHDGVISARQSNYLFSVLVHNLHLPIYIVYCILLLSAMVSKCILETDTLNVIDYNQCMFRLCFDLMAHFEHGSILYKL